MQLGNPVAVNQQETVICTPCTDGTGTVANQVTWTSTNITGAPVWSFSIATTAFDLSALARAIEHATEIHGGRNRGHARVASGICNARLGVCLGRSCWPRRQLKHRRLLTLT